MNRGDVTPRPEIAPYLFGYPQTVLQALSGTPDQTTPGAYWVFGWGSQVYLAPALTDYSFYPFFG